MINWNYNPAEFTERNFNLIPEGDYRVVIKSVKEKIYSTGNEGFEIMFDVLGHNGKLWYNLVLDPADTARTNQRLGMFFDSFAITNTDLSWCDGWIGKDGAVRVKHNIYNGKTSASVAFCLSRSQQQKFPDFNSSYTAPQDMTANHCGSYGEQQNTFNGFNRHNIGRVESYFDF